MENINKVQRDRLLKSYHTVMSYELDSFGHVNNAVFLNYLEKARCDFMTLRGLSFNDFSRWKKYPVVARASIEYKNTATADDKLLIKGWVSNHTAASFTLKYEIFNQENKKLVLKGETFHIFINDNNKPSRIPEEFYLKFIK